MILLDKKDSVYYPLSFGEGTLILERNLKKKNGRLIYEFNSERKIVFDRFDVGSVSLDTYFVNLAQYDAISNVINTYLLDDNFNIIKESGEDFLFSYSTEKYYYSKKKTGDGLFCLETDELVLPLQSDPNFKIKRIFNDSFFIEIFNETHIITIRNIETKSNIEVDITSILKPPIIAEEDKRFFPYDDNFKFSEIYNDKLIVAAGHYLVLIDCTIGAILSTFNIKHQPDQFLFDPPYIYCHSGRQFLKYKIEDDNTIIQLYKHVFEKAKKEFEDGIKVHIQLTNLKSLFLYDNKIYGLNDHTPSFLLIHDAETGKRLQAIDLRPFGIKQAYQVSVVHNKIYIIDLVDNLVTILEREKGE